MEPPTLEGQVLGGQEQKLNRKVVKDIQKIA